MEHYTDLEGLSTQELKEIFPKVGLCSLIRRALEDGEEATHSRPDNVHSAAAVSPTLAEVEGTHPSPNNNAPDHSASSSTLVELEVYASEKATASEDDTTLQDRAATCLQAVQRSRMCKHVLTTKRDAATKLQAWARKRSRDAATKLQAAQQLKLHLAAAEATDGAQKPIALAADCAPETAAPETAAQTEDVSTVDEPKAVVSEQGSIRSMSQTQRTTTPVLTQMLAGATVSVIFWVVSLLPAPP